MMSLGMLVTKENQKGVRTVSPDKRDWIRRESEAILTRNILLREKTKEVMYEKRLQHEKLVSQNRDERVNRWVDKTKNSPFAVNLVAEDERITEENQIRLKEEHERRRMIDNRKEKAKNEIILKVMIFLVQCYSDSLIAICRHYQSFLILKLFERKNVLF